MRIDRPFTLAAALWFSAAAVSADGADLLADGLSPKIWKVVSAKSEEGQPKTWTLRTEGGPVLSCRGQPFGYLRTAEAYGDFQLSLEWRTPEGPDANTGVLLHTGEDRVWPSAVQVQLHGPASGSIFPVGGAECDGDLRLAGTELKPVGEWNACEITSKGDSVSVVINGGNRSRLAGCRTANGPIALQSEGSAVEFRNVLLTPLPVEKATDEPVDGNAVPPSGAGSLPSGDGSRGVAERPAEAGSGPAPGGGGGDSGRVDS